MATDPVVVERYADALFGRAVKEGQLQALADEIRELLPILRGISGLRGFMEAPQIPRERKRALIEKTVARTEASQLDEFALLLIDKGRIDHFGPILERFLVMEEEHRGVFPADVTSAVILDDAQRTVIQRALEAHTGHTLDITFHVDPRVIGGVVFRHRDELLDTTLRTGIDEIGASIGAVRVH
jgi:F-type H+-transporting ATPase subunit delta